MSDRINPFGTHSHGKLGYIVPYIYLSLCHFYDEYGDRDFTGGEDYLAEILDLEPLALRRAIKMMVDDGLVSREGKRITFLTEVDKF